jgi:hypothetical protein
VRRRQEGSESEGTEEGGGLVMFPLYSIVHSIVYTKDISNWRDDEMTDGGSVCVSVCVCACV